MAKKKYYAVKTGKTRGIFLTWEDCKTSVDGYPGAQYKSFPSEEEARLYLGTDAKEYPLFAATDRSLDNTVSTTAGRSLDHTAATVPDRSAMTHPPVAHHPGQVVAYVDGSFDVKIGRYSFGCVLITPEGDVVEQSGNGDNPDSLALRNVTGEMLGAMFAVQWCIKNGYSAVDIRYDYSGIEMWAAGKWKAKNELTQKYAAYMQRNNKRINITFTKIAAHTGDYYNEQADALAKRALTEGNGIPKI